MNGRCRAKICIDILEAAKEGKAYSRLMQNVGINFKTWNEVKHQLYDAGLLRMYVGRKRSGAWPSNLKKRVYGRKYETTVAGRQFLADFRKLLKKLSVNC